MEFEWDPAKAHANRAKHNVAFEDAAYVWDDPDYQVYPAKTVQEEERWKAIGTVDQITLLVVIHTLRSENRIRIISARKAKRREKLHYQEQAAQHRTD